VTEGKDLHTQRRRPRKTRECKKRIFLPILASNCLIQKDKKKRKKKKEKDKKK
jgi:hypothetical protein